MNPLDLLALLVEPLSYEFMLRALATALIASIVSAVLSCWLVLIGWSLMGDAVSHAVLPGVVIAYLLGAPFALGAIVFGLLAVALIGGVRDTSKIKEDAAIGIVFTSLFALGLVLISIFPTNTDLSHILFGSLLGVSWGDFVQLAVLAFVVLAVLLAKRRDFTLFAFDPTHAHAIGLNPRLIGAALLGLLALTAVVGLQAVGVILVVAMLIIPGATARLLTDRFGRMLVLAPVIAGVCAIVGLYASYYLDTATGPMVVLAQSACFGVAYLVNRFPSLLGISRRSRRSHRSRLSRHPVPPASPR